MPELPEVETLKMELSAHCLQCTIIDTVINNPTLRYRVNHKLPELLYNQRILEFSRRGRYLIMKLNQGHLIIHLGMSGELSIRKIEHYQKKKHEHVTFFLNNNVVLSFCDPRKFGSVVFSTLSNIEEHKLLKNFGPEPLSSNFSGSYLYKLASKTTKPIKTLLMDNHCVTGIGNIYVAEILFASGIAPARPSRTLTLEECITICQISKKILHDAIKKGGTTIKDFKNSKGEKGYFQQDLKIYGKNSQPCPRCNIFITKTLINNRSTYSCNQCQK